MTTPKFSPEALAGIADQLTKAEQEIGRLRSVLRDIDRATQFVDLSPGQILDVISLRARAALTESPR